MKRMKQCFLLTGLGLILWACQPVNEKVELKLEYNGVDFLPQKPHGFSGIQSLEDKRETSTEAYGHRLVASSNTGAFIIKQASVTLTPGGFKSSSGGNFFLTSSVHSDPDGEILEAQ